VSSGRSVTLQGGISKRKHIKASISFSWTSSDWFGRDFQVVHYRIQLMCMGASAGVPVDKKMASV